MAKNAPSAVTKSVHQESTPADLFRNNAVPFVGIALALAGSVLSFILTSNFFHHSVLGQSSGCAVNAYIDCDRVSRSSFAAIGGVPISVFGLGMHIVVLVALIMAHLGRARVREGLVGSITVLALAAAVVSVVLAAISLFVIRALCIYCTALQLVNLALAGVLTFGLTGGAGRIKQLLPSFSGSALGAGALAVGVGAGVAAISAYGISTAADRQFLEQRIMEARDSRRVSDWYLGFEKFEFEVDDSPQLGNPDAPITLVVFADYNCPGCHYFDPKITKVAREAADVRLVYKFYPRDSTCNRLFPSNYQSTSCAAAAAAYIAHLEGKFWEYNDRLFANFQRYGPSSLVAYAQEVDLANPELARNALDNRSVRNRIDSDISEADKASVRGTPTLYINGRVFRRDRITPNRDEFSVIRTLLAELRVD